MESDKCVCYTKLLEVVKNNLLTGNINTITNEVIDIMNSQAAAFIMKRDLVGCEITDLTLILDISNILYNNTNRDVLPLEDGVYDLLVELYRVYNPNVPFGATPVEFEEFAQDLDKQEQLRQPFTIIDRDDLLFEEEIIGDMNVNKPLYSPFDIDEGHIENINRTVSKRITEVSHLYPELVGTLDKCKFVLNHQAEEKGVMGDPTVKVFERDFINKHIDMGIIDPAKNIRLLLMLKYDGISVEAEVSNRVLSARTRGDTENDKAADLTPILYNYPFPKALASGIADKDTFGMAFEAIITYEDLEEFNRRRTDKATDYKNARTAIIGLFGSSDAYKYRDLITLVPLYTSHHISRDVELELMNKYYAGKQTLRGTIIEGNLIEVLFQVKRFAEEAEYMRQHMPFMYDGIVVSYVDQDIIEKLGRVNSVNQYAIAIKFNPIKRQTTFKGYTYTVGQDGTITPMLHYNPVEFYGTIHTKSSGHSYRRFKELDLRVGDIIDVDYVNDVMPYVTKPDNSHNVKNAEKVDPVVFPIRCPECYTELTKSNSEKSIVCSNIDCPGRLIARIVNMFSKLDIKDFAEANIKELDIKSFSDFISMTTEKLDASSLGDVMKQKFMERVNTLKTNPIEDYKLIGSLGFNNIGRRVWKRILFNISLEEVLSLSNEELVVRLTSIKGIGKVMANTIVNERKYYIEDLLMISKMSNVIRTLGMSGGKTVRFTGVRNKAFEEQLNELGFDADSKASVTKTTDILVIPHEGFTSSKTKKVSDECIILPIEKFMQSPESYL